jgi:Xaa-Pro aminopeptidase
VFPRRRRAKLTDVTEDDEGRRAAELLEAQAKAEQLFAAVDEHAIIRPGAWDKEASHAVRDLAADLFGVRRHWHKRIVRSGEHTLMPYKENPPDRQMTDDDIVFADFGPIFEDWEADFGRTWVIGDDPVKLRLRDDLADVFAAGKQFFDDHPDITGEELYAEVLRLTAERGWSFGNEHCGHIVGEFPHEDFPGERPESHLMVGSTKPMRRPDPSGRVTHWILEVHLVDLERRIGGFYEQLLTL